MPPTNTRLIEFVRQHDIRGAQAGTDTTAVALPMPTGNLEGKLLTAIVVATGNPTISGWPAGWNVGVPYTANGTAVCGEIRWRIADGTEADLALTLSSSRNWCGSIIVDSGHSCSIMPPVFSTVVTGTSTQPNPGALTPPWPANPGTLWRSGHFAADDHETATWWPSGWARGGFQESDTSGSDTCTLAYAIRYSELVTEDPGTFALGSSAAWIAWTMAVPPGVEGVTNHAFPRSIRETRNTATTSHSVNEPEGLEVGDELVVIFASDGAPTWTWPAELTAISGLADTANGVAVKAGARHRIIDGTETWPMTITTGASEDSSVIAIRLERGSTTTPPVGGINTATGTFVTSNAISPAGGEADFCWLIAAACDNVASFAEPEWWATGQTPIAQVRSSAGADSVLLMASWRAAYKDTLGGFHRPAASATAVCLAIAVYPAPIEPTDFEEGYEEGYDDGFADGVVSVGLATPVVTFTPATGAQLSTTHSTVQVDVTDADGNLTGVILTCKLSGTRETLVVFDGSKFVYPFLGEESIRTTIANGFRFVFRQYPKWPGDITALRAYAFDGHLEGGLP